jgi:anti-anti-sigma factor
VPLNQATFSNSALDGTAVLSISGEIDIGNKEQLELALHKGLAQASHIFIANLLDVTYADSACIHALHHAQRTAERMDKALIVVIKKGGGLQKILQIAGLLQFFTICHSLDDALAGKSNGKPKSD